MSVRVKILVSSLATDKNLDSMKAAAAELTDNRQSIAVTMQEGDPYYELIADFTMKRAAQYKVVNDIAHTFKFWTWDVQDYQDMIISFPKAIAEIERQKRKQQRRKHRG
ncbi:MAG: hypothetical protein HC866_05350 [Leptolyngbyaceae cyanobacterium RU_5_1]|nr:hypothetical protein [Leptolyngbyaceae cyanobacterium RU_5_1]